MNCLMGDPTTERELSIIDKAAELGCEYYCLDAGWYDDGFWWDRVGEWKEASGRFPNGLKEVCDHANKLPDDWFVCRHGKRHIDNKRYMLDFRNPEVRKYCRDVVDRLINDYGVEYFKVDYNVTMGYGSDLNSDSCADAIREHYECLHQWYEEIFRDHPELVVENCGSGGQRMDYGMLKILSLQSTSDQTDYLYNANIAANVASAVTPEQGGMWVYPYEDEEEHVIYNVVNGMLLRPYISGMVWKLGENSMNRMKEGISLYKEIREEVRDGVPLMTDANLQYSPLGGTQSSASSSSAEGSRNITNSGVDMRAISTDDIESVEVMRGIPSAEYGNLTSGLVSIRKIRRAMPLTVRFKADGYSKLFSAGKGVNLNRRGTSLLNMDLGYLDSKTDPTDNLENYKRLTASLRYTIKADRKAYSWSWNSALDYQGSFDNAKADPDLNYGHIDEYRSSYNRVAMTNNFMLKPRNSVWSEVAVNSMVSLQTDRLRQTRLVAPQRYGIVPLSWTNGENEAQAVFAEYVAHYLCDGKPFSAYVKAKGVMGFKTGRATHTLKSALFRTGSLLHCLFLLLKHFYNQSHLFIEIIHFPLMMFHLAGAKRICIKSRIKLPEHILFFLLP